MGSPETAAVATHPDLHSELGGLEQFTFSEPRRFSAPPSEPALFAAARAGDARLVVTFGGQGPSWIEELRELHAAHLAVRTLVRTCSDRLRASVDSAHMGALGAPARGFDLVRWIEHPESAPTSAVLTSSLLSQPGLFVTQISRLVAMAERGFDLDVLRSLALATSGHSQGVMGALLFSEGHAFPALVRRAAEFAVYFLWQGYRMQEACLQTSVPSAVRGISEAAGLGEPTPMAAISGLSRESLEGLLQHFHKTYPHMPPIDVSLENTWMRRSISAPAPSLVAFAKLLSATRDAEKTAFANGTIGRKPIEFRWEFIAASAPYHSRYMEHGARHLPGDLAREGIRFSRAAIGLPVLAHDGHDLRNEASDDALLKALVHMQHLEPLRWTDICTALRKSHPEGITHVLDYGPGDAVAKLTSSNCRGFGVHVMALATETGRREAMSALDQLPRGLDYRRFAPKLRRETTGEIVIDNAFRRFTGRAPIFLPGMTPTTVEAPIVAAASAAGFVSELAGGGQPTERHFRLRTKELAKLLPAGASYCVNLLYLDPYLWNLHWKTDRLVLRLRDEGAAIEGVTVSAGIPELAEARELLENCRAHGLDLVSFKPGTPSQIKQVLEIARACPEITFGIQIEGGKAGGHHSWEDLREVVRTHYHAIREQPNLVLSVGGGIRTEADAFEWLSGRWSERVGLAPMPVDGVFVGTLCMATAEAMTSPQVKALLVQTPGTDEWVARDASKGGVTSGRSQLDADIHYTDNTAARVGRLLDEVAGKPDAARARKAELVAALAKTAKPYFGDVAEMTPAQMLRRMVELMAIGRGTEYEDGRWPDPSYRQRVFDEAIRLEERLVAAPGPSILASPADLDDPDAFIARFVAKYPQAETAALTEADADDFVERICARPGKPVNFVPVIDGDVRRWYKSDALWQSHDDRYPADAVLVIPGPEAVQGIARADEPVGELLHRFVNHAIARLRDEGLRPVSVHDGVDRANVAQTARSCGLVLQTETDTSLMATAPVAEALAARSSQAWLQAIDPIVLGPLAAATGVVREGVVVANPLARVLRVMPGDRWLADIDSSGRLRSLVIQRHSGHALEVVVSRHENIGRCELTFVHALPATGADLRPDIRLTLAFTRDLAHGARLPSDVTLHRAERISTLYRSAMVGEGAPVLPGDEVHARVTVTRDFIQEYALATGDTSPAHVSETPRALPLNAAFSAGFAAIFRATFVPEAAWDPSRLVHLSNSVHHLGAPLREDETLDVTARLVSFAPAKGGTRIQTEATLRTGDAVRARVDSAFFVQGDASTFLFRDEHRQYRLPAGDGALLDLLAEKSWIRIEADARFDSHVSHTIALSIRTKEVRGDVLDTHGRKVATILHNESSGDIAESEPVRWLAHFAKVVDEAVPLPRLSAVYVESTTAPKDLIDFARASRDLNPLHRDPHLAALAGFDSPIVHGQWTAARSVAAAVAGFADSDGRRVRGIDVSFTDVVNPGDALEITARHSGMHIGDAVVDVEASVQSGAERRTALRGRVHLAAPRTAYVFPGQGVQSTGMGMAGYAQSAAARRIWDAADSCCRERHGFSLLTVVRDNPHELRVGRDILRHEQGVLFLTQFTQVSMAVLAIAQVAELREAGCFNEEAPFCGHSVGEYSAIGAITGALPLEAVVDCVYHRGLTMQYFVPRDHLGRSPYRMAVVRPNIVKMSEHQLVELTAQVARETGLLCEVVNYNIRGRQYAVVGHTPALEALHKALVRREPPGAKPSFMEVPGIDVPFHSKALRDGVPAFREKLELYTPLDMDVGPLIGRYIPNLVAKPFSVSRAYLDDVIGTTGSEVLIALRARWDAEQQPPAELGRALFIEGLAYQFASPVRWIETQDVLLARHEMGVQRVIEIGLASAPTQANMFRATLAREPRFDSPTVLNIEIDRKSVFHLYAEAPVAPAPTPTAAAPTAPSAKPAAVARSKASITDAPPTARDALMTIVALKARIRVDEIRPEESIETLLGGNSSRRNQILADIGAEFELGAIDGAHELPITKLAETIEKSVGGRYRTQGPYLRAQVATALKPLGLTTKDVLAQGTTKGLPEGRSITWLNRLALWARTGESTRQGSLAPITPPKAGDRNAAAAWLDSSLDKYADEAGFQFSAGTDSSAGGTVDSAALDAMLARYFGVGGAFVESLRFAESALGRDVWADLEVRAPEAIEDTQRLGRYETEHGAAYEKAIQPTFHTEQIVHFSGSWAWARRDALSLYYELRAGTTNPELVDDRIARLARSGDEATARTASWLYQRAQREGNAAIAGVFEQLVARLDPSKNPHAMSEASAMRPRVEIRSDGTLHSFDAPTNEALNLALASMHARGVDDVDARTSFTQSLQSVARGEVSFTGQTALVTGASERSIAIELVKLLLSGGARVVVTTSRLTPERTQFYRRLFQRYGARGAELVVAPFNQGSRQDSQKLIAWLTSADKATGKEPWLIDLLVPFAATGEDGTLAELSDRSMATLRILLYGVEMLISECAQAMARSHQRDSRTHVLLPLSPNHGQFGNDGLYGETKAALEALLNRWSSEQAAWGRHASVVGARIGWVRGTGLMNVNDAIAPGLETRTGVRTFSSAEMGLLLGACCTPAVREQAARRPLVADLTGGMDSIRDLSGVASTLRRELMDASARARQLMHLRRDEATTLGKQHAPARHVSPAPRFADYFAFPPLPDAARREQLADLRHLDLSKVSVIVGLGEAGPWGNARPRWSMESSGELSLEACIELAWMTGRIRYEHRRGYVGWVDAKSSDAVREQDVKARYETELIADSGIRIIDPKLQGFDPRSSTVWADVALEKELVFPVPSQAEGESYVRAAGEGARLIFDPAKDGWFIVRRKGSIVKVARAARLDRYVAGQIPSGWDPVRYGIPKPLIEQVDRTTLFSLIATVEAFLDAGLEPEELYEYLHLADVGNTQGAGIGGVQKLKRLYMDYPLDRARQGDVLQETLINVTAAWVVQSLVGSYGPMAHPVAACATAAVSLESAVDKIACGKAAFVVAGAFDDYGEEGAVGFADMAATASADEMLARGVPPRAMSRPNDCRRHGFVEGQGGGTMLVARADLAVRMGLPIHAIVATAGSYADGIHRSIPAPGPGVMAVAAERPARSGESSGAELSALSQRVAEWNAFQARMPEVRRALGDEAAEAVVRDERRRRFHEFHAGDERISPLRRGLATFGLTPDDVATCWKHDTSTEANDVNENRALDRIMRWLGRDEGNPLVAVSQKALTGHAKGGAAAWQIAGLCQGLASGVIPGNPNLDDPDPAMRPFDMVAFTDRPLFVGRFEAGLVTSLGFGHVGGVLCLVHPDRVLAALDDAAFATYAARRAGRERDRLRKQLSVLQGTRPQVSLRTDKQFQVPAGDTYAGLDPEHAALLDASSRRLQPGGPIVVGGAR